MTLPRYFRNEFWEFLLRRKKLGIMLCASAIGIDQGQSVQSARADHMEATLGSGVYTNSLRERGEPSPPPLGGGSGGHGPPPRPRLER